MVNLDGCGSKSNQEWHCHVSPPNCHGHIFCGTVLSSSILWSILYFSCVPPLLISWDIISQELRSSSLTSQVFPPVGVWNVDHLSSGFSCIWALQAVTKHSVDIFTGKLRVQAGPNSAPWASRRSCWSFGSQWPSIVILIVVHFTFPWLW